MHSKAINLIFIIITIITCYAFTTLDHKIAIEKSDIWVLAKNENNIKVYTRIPKGSKIREIKVVTTLNGSINKIENFIDDINSYSKWQTNIATAKVLKTLDKSTQYLYFTSDVPWPITNRDVVLLSKKTVTSDSVIIYDLSGVPDYINENPNFIRVKNIRCICKIKSSNKNNTVITFESFGDPEGSIPHYLINLFIIESPYSTFVNLKKIIEENNY